MTIDNVRKTVMQRRTVYRRACYALLYALAFLPYAGKAASYHVAPTSLIRYHFAVGERFTYRIIKIARQVTRLAEHSPSIFSGQLDKVISYHITQILPSGTAIALVRVESLVDRSMENGRTTVTRGLSPAYATQSRALLGADNSLPGKKDWDVTPYSFGDYGFQSLGPLPAYSIAPGAHWNTTAIEPIGGFTTIQTLVGYSPPARMDARNTLLGYQRVTSHPVAAIESIGTIDYSQNTSGFTGDAYGYKPKHIHIVARDTLHSLFDLQQRHLRACTNRLSFHYTVTISTSKGMHTLEQGQFSETDTIQEISG